MSDIYKPETLDALAERGFKAIQDAYNSGYILGNENAEARIIEIIERCPRIDNDYMIQCDARHLIALIKGETE